MTPGESEGSTRLPRALLADEPTTGLDAFQVPVQKEEKSSLGCQKGGCQNPGNEKVGNFFPKIQCYDPGTCF